MEKGSEFYRLVNSLKADGLYENGMDLEEMRKIQEAIDESIDKSSDFEDIQAALRESENMACASFSSESRRSFINNDSLDISNSGQMPLASSPPSCNNSPKLITIFAEIHAEMDFSPIRHPREQVARDIVNQSDSIESDLGYYFEDADDIFYMDDCTENLEE